MSKNSPTFYGCIKLYFVTPLSHRVFDGVLKWLLSEDRKEEATVSPESLQSDNIKT